MNYFDYLKIQQNIYLKIQRNIFPEHPIPVKLLATACFFFTIFYIHSYRLFAAVVVNVSWCTWVQSPVYYNVKSDSWLLPPCKDRQLCSVLKTMTGKVDAGESILFLMQYPGKDEILKQVYWWNFPTEIDALGQLFSWVALCIKKGKWTIVWASLFLIGQNTQNSRQTFLDLSEKSYSLAVFWL